MKNPSTRRVIFIAAVIMLMLWVVLNYRVAIDVVAFLFTLVMPFIVGLCFAFILDILMRFLESRLLDRVEGRLPEGRARSVIARGKRVVSLLLTLAIVFGILVFVIATIVPEIRNTVAMLVSQIPAHASALKELSADLSANLGLGVDVYDYVAENWGLIGKKLLDLLAGGDGDFAITAVNMTKSIFSTFANTIIGLVFAIYVLVMKERLTGQFRAAAVAFFSEKAAARIFRTTHLASRVFSGFVRGQMLEVVIITVLVTIGTLVISPRYAVMFGVLLGICSFIPVVGSIIGTLVATFILLADNPWDALAFLIFVLVMQQVESNVIYPRVVGSIISLPGIWVLLAVLAGAAVGGIVGVVVGVPLCALLYSMLRDGVRSRLDEKNITTEMIDGIVEESREEINRSEER